MGWYTHIILKPNKKIANFNGDDIYEKAENNNVLIEDIKEINQCIFVSIIYGYNNEILIVIDIIENLYNVKIDKIRIEGTDYYEFPSWRSFEDDYNGVKSFCENQNGGAAKKRITKKRSTKKRSTKKRSTKKRSTKKRSTKKRSTKKRSAKKAKSPKKRLAKK